MTKSKSISAAQLALLKTVTATGYVFALEGSPRRAALALVRRGLLTPCSVWTMFEITDEGRSWLSQALAQQEGVKNA